MTLEEYLASRGFGANKRLSIDTGLAPTMISRIRTRTHPTSIETAIKIEQATNGEVRVEEMVPQFAELIAYLRGTEKQLCLNFQQHQPT